MFKLSLSQQQLQNLVKMLDITLKVEGLNMLNPVVDLHNAIMSAQLNKEAEESKPDKEEQMNEVERDT